MKTNISSTDRMLRVIFAVIVAFLYFTHILTGTLGIILMIMGGILLLTSVINFCPIYHMLGITTRKKTNQDGISHQI